MRSLFAARGSCYNCRVTPPVSVIDLGPTAARILGLDLPGAEGVPLVEALADAPAR